MTNRDCIKIINSKVLIPMKVIPGSNKNLISGFRNGELIIKINAQPEKGKANKKLISFLAKKIKCAGSSIEIIKGHTSRHKTVLLPKAFLDIIDPFINKKNS